MNSERDWPFISIVVPVYNREGTIDKCIESLLALDYPDYEIVFGDGGSTDGTIDLIKAAQEKDSRIKYVVVPESKNPGWARNPAVHIAKGEIICFTDSDCAPHEDWVMQLVEPFLDHEDIGSAGGEVETKFISHSFAEVYADEFDFFGHGFPEGKMKWNMAGYGTCNVAFRKDALEEVEMDYPDGLPYMDEEENEQSLTKLTFDPTFKTGEDQDLNARVNRAGYSIYCKPDALVDHMHRLTVKAALTQWFWRGDAGPHIFSKHFPKQLRIRFFNHIILKTWVPIPIHISVGAFHVFLLSLLGLILEAVTGTMSVWMSAGLGALCLYSLQILSRKFYKAKNKILIPFFVLFQFLHCGAWLLGWFFGAFRHRAPLTCFGPSFDWKKGEG